MTSIVLLARKDEAERMKMPQMVRLTAMPIVDGQLGRPFACQEIPLMIR